MSTPPEPADAPPPDGDPSAFPPGRPVVLRGGTVLTMDDRRTVLPEADVLVVDGRIAAVGPELAAPEDAAVIDARGGIVLPGMVDTHRHMWQTALRGYGADWTLTQYFVFNYLEWGKEFRPEDVHAGNLLAAVEALDAGVTTTVDWSHGLRTPEHGDAAADALESVPGRFVLAYGNLHAAPWEWATAPGFRAFLDRRFAGTPRGELPTPGARPGAPGRLGLQLAFDITGDPAFPERAAFAVARELGVAVTTHAGVWGATDDVGVRLMHEHGAMAPGTVYVHAASLGADSYQRIAATGGTVSVSAESEQSAGQGYPPTRELRAHGVPVSLSMDTSVWQSADLFSAMRATLGADRAAEHAAAHATGETVTHAALRADEVVEWATRGGARALGLDDRLGSVRPGFRADLVLLRNDASPAMFPLLHPHGHVVLQAQRGDVHSVLVDGRVVKHRHRLLDVDLAAVRRRVEATVEHLRGRLGEAEWRRGMNPDIPERRVLENPYTYTDAYRDAPPDAG